MIRKLIFPVFAAWLCACASTSTVEITPDKERFLKTSVVKQGEQILYLNKVGWSSRRVGYKEWFSTSPGFPNWWCTRDGIVLTEQSIYAVWNLFEVASPADCYAVEAREHSQPNYIKRWNYSDVTSIERRKLYPEGNAQIIRLVLRNSEYVDMFYFHSDEVKRIYEMLAKRIAPKS